MTVCVAALAEDSKAIVLVADKALTYGDNIYRPAITDDTGIEKMIPIGQSGWNALFAGNPSHATAIVREAETYLEQLPDADRTVHEMMECLKHAFQSVRETAVIDSVLTPRLLTKESLVARPSDSLPLPENMVNEVFDTIARFSLQRTLLVGGFDRSGVGHVFSVSDPGITQSHDQAGFGAIGIGEEIAISELLRFDAEPEDEAEIALYQAFAAKAQAEIIEGVGANSDLWIMANGRTEAVAPAIRELVETVFTRQYWLPFKPRKGWTAPPDPPQNWETRLTRYVRGVLRGDGGPSTDGSAPPPAESSKGAAKGKSR